MPKYVITGTKKLKNGTAHTISETAPSPVKAEWVKAMYVAEGYVVTIVEESRT